MALSRRVFTNSLMRRRIPVERIDRHGAPSLRTEDQGVHVQLLERIGVLFRETRDGARGGDGCVEIDRRSATIPTQQRRSLQREDRRAYLVFACRQQ